MHIEATKNFANATTERNPFSNRDLRLVAEHFETRLKRILETDPQSVFLAAGLTRLRKIEMLDKTCPSILARSKDDRIRLEESLLMGARQQRYQAVGTATIGKAGLVVVHLERRGGKAVSISTPYRLKRYRCVSFGSSRIEPGRPRWFNAFL